MTTKPEPFLDIREAALHVGFSVGHLHRLRQTGDFPKPDHVGVPRAGDGRPSCVRWYPSTLDAWREAHPTYRPNRKKTEEQKLVDFFRSLEGDALGREGDDHNWTPAETAIYFMRKYLEHEAAADERQLFAGEYE